jgi:hypothetical protein
MNHTCAKSLADTIDLFFYPNRINYNIIFERQFLDLPAKRIRHPCTTGSLVERLACLLKSLPFSRRQT